MQHRENGIHRRWQRTYLIAILRVAPVPALTFFCGACGGAAPRTALSPAEVAGSGTLVLDAPRQTVLDACVLALRKQGYAIDVAEPETGLVVTMRRPAAQGALPGPGLFRAYVLEVKAIAGRRSQVWAWPAVSERDMARGTRPFRAPAWDLDEERATWARLFEDVRGIVERASP